MKNIYLDFLKEVIFFLILNMKRSIFLGMNFGKIFIYIFVDIGRVSPAPKFYLPILGAPSVSNKLELQFFYL